MKVLKDGHVHSPYCPHGTKDTFEQYIEKAITLKYDEISFTEHAPLPSTFKDPVPSQDSAISINDLEHYITKIKKLKKIYAQDIKINVGLEVDYIEGYEEETATFLNDWGTELDDSILSTHFILCPNNEYICLDYSPKSMEQLLKEYSSLERVYEKYYATLHKSIKADLGFFKPRRIGHMTLIRKFQKRFPRNFDDNILIESTLLLIKKHEYSLDINGAGLTKPLCQEMYPPIPWVERAAQLNIPLVYGSDAHSAKQLGQGIEQLQRHLLF
ncbi:histidinol-phosphatase HisJ [Evansella cellulosilytica]|uniref:Histidinol-phosphatase n=1 Tax=Evansella cellulosilytica (strain ATCC 21833 / DSM 2522 / FERM P-1141 / JCM 9156 / N-4) TaxID=649639 RepID=E6U155_EVAC2|nr:histidinol-phosphatase HisJ [Evansella cellulosilytica]ADU31501.1 histidinol phosphate phosphatase HisJ family [Evansella cellulosilytica DSM 2522]